ncbi:hypothetical protein D3C74_321670 [compost metagenome]
MEMTQAFIEIETLMKKEKDRRMFERYQAIVLHLKGRMCRRLQRSLEERNERSISICVPIAKPV